MAFIDRLDRRMEMYMTRPQRMCSNLVCCHSCKSIVNIMRISTKLWSITKPILLFYQSSKLLIKEVNFSLDVGMGGGRGTQGREDLNYRFMVLTVRLTSNQLD